MKIKCQKQSLVQALQSVNAVATQRDLYPVLENVRISALDNQVILRATDLKIALTYLLPQGQAIIEEKGEILIPAARLQSLVKETPDNEVILEKKEFNALLTSQHSHCRILGEDPAKFPEIPEFKEQTVLEITGEDFQKLIKKTLFATTAEKTRYDLDNVLVTLIDQSLRFVATDGKRLALCDRPCKVVGQMPSTKLTVPSKCLQQIERVLSATNPAAVMLSFVDNQLLFRTPEVILSTRLSEAKFPPYERVIPKNLATSIPLSVKDFTSALRRVCVFSDEKSKIVELSFGRADLKFFSMGEGTGDATVEIPIQFPGTPFLIKFNAGFLLDMIKVIEGDEFTIWIHDGQSPMLIKDGTDFQYVVLPIKTEEGGA